jgi:hypothetical protein
MLMVTNLTMTITITIILITLFGTRDHTSPGRRAKAGLAAGDFEPDAARERDRQRGGADQRECLDQERFVHNTLFANVPVTPLAARSRSLNLRRLSSMRR